VRGSVLAVHGSEACTDGGVLSAGLGSISDPAVPGSEACLHGGELRAGVHGISDGEGSGRQACPDGGVLRAGVHGISDGEGSGGQACPDGGVLSAGFNSVSSRCSSELRVTDPIWVLRRPEARAAWMTRPEVILMTVAASLLSIFWPVSRITEVIIRLTASSIKLSSSSYILYSRTRNPVMILPAIISQSTSLGGCVPALPRLGCPFRAMLAEKFACREVRRLERI
jgi:hypothetical protein